LTDAEIEKMINDAAKFKKADQQAKKRRETIIRMPSANWFLIHSPNIAGWTSFKRSSAKSPT
jgi:hypothetical protein